MTEHWSRLSRELVESPSLGDVQNFIGQDPEQPAVADPALGVVDRLDNCQRSSPISAAPCFFKILIVLGSCSSCTNSKTTLLILHSSRE